MNSSDKTNEKKMYNAQMAAEILCVSNNTLTNWRHKRRGPAYHKIGGRIYYSNVDLMAYLAARRIDPEVSIR